MSLTILLVDDHIILRSGIKAFLEATSDFLIVGEANTGEEALKLLDSVNPDIIVMDYLIPGMGGLETLRQIKRRFPEKYVIILSLYTEKSYKQAAFKAGACSYILKEDILRDLEQVIRDCVCEKPFSGPTRIT